MTITLPYPPSANRYWRHNRGVTHRSTEAVDYINTVGALCLAARVRPTAGPVVVSVDIYRPAKRGDLDNTLKVLLDSLRGYTFVDDDQVIEIRARRFDDKDNPRAEVRVELYSSKGEDNLSRTLEGILEDLLMADIKESDGSFCSATTHRASAYTDLAALIPNYVPQDAEMLEVLRQAQEEIGLLRGGKP